MLRAQPSAVACRHISSAVPGPVCPPMTTALHSLASRARHATPFRALEPAFRRVEPLWNRTLAATLYRRGFPVVVNGETIRLGYAYGARLAKQHAYEPDIAVPFAAAIQPGVTVLDIGAHVGVLSLIAAQRVGPRGRVVAFEPAPASLAALRAHCRYNGAVGDRVTIAPVVASDAEGTVPFYTFGDSMAASLAKANVAELNAQHPTTVTSVEVRAVRLDHYCVERGWTIDVIKIDVEGAELRVLRGARALLERDRPRVFCEIHPKQMANVGDSVAELETFVRSVGYRLTPLAAPGHHGIYPTELSPYA